MNNLVSTTATLPTDWAGLYQTIQTQGNVPSPASQSLGQTHSVFQAMYLDLGVIAQTLLTTGGNPPLVTVYADVLNIPDNLNWNLQDSVLMVVARRIEAGANVRFNLDYRTGQNAGLVLFFNELGGAISAVAATLDQGAVKPWPFNITAPPGDGGLQILLQQGVPTLLTRTRAQGMPFVMPDAFESALTTSYIVASLLYDQRPDIALGIFNFNKDWAASSPQFAQRIFAQFGDGDAAQRAD